MSNIKVFVVEDNHQTGERLTEYIKCRSELKFSGLAATGEEALKILKYDTCDLLLLDVHLPDMSGMEILEHLNKIPHVIFITAYDKYAVKAFELGAIDYLLKPFSQERFNHAIDRFSDNWNSKKTSLESTKEIGLSFSDKGKNYLFAYNDIIYISSHGKHSVVHTVYEDFEISKLLKNMEGRLPAAGFFRIHRQYIVNYHYVLNLNHLGSGLYELCLKDEDSTSLPVGRTFVDDVKKRMILL